MEDREQHQKNNVMRPDKNSNQAHYYYIVCVSVCRESERKR